MSEPASDGVERAEPVDPSELEAPEGVIGPIRIEAGSAFSARYRLAVRGLNVSGEKEKVSLTLDGALMATLRSITAPKQLSATVNELLYRALEQARLRTLVEELETEKGPASEEVYERLLEDWFRDAD